MTILYRVVMEKRLVAAQNMLDGLKSLPNFDGIVEKQYKAVLGSIQQQAKKANTSVALVTSFLASLRVDLWGDQRSEALKGEVASLVSQDGEDAGPRRSMQNFEQFWRHLPLHLWEKAGDRTCKRQTVTQALCMHMICLGLRCPSEPTSGSMTCWVHCMHGESNLQWDDKISKLKQHKAIFQKLKEKISKEPACYLDFLPVDFKEIPGDLAELAFPNGSKPAEPPENFGSRLAAAMATFPLRGSNQKAVVVSEPEVKLDPKAFQEALAMVSPLLNTFLANQMMQRPASEQEIPLQFLKPPAVNPTAVATQVPLGNGSAQEPEQRLLPAPSQVMQAIVAEARDALVKEEPEPKPEQMVEQLRKQLRGDPEKDGETKPREKSKPKAPAKRPAAKPHPRPKKSAKQEGDSVKKRPSSREVEHPSGRLTAEDREKFLKKIPKGILNQYRNGCPRCRHRQFCTVSCWKSRGY